MKSIIIFLSFVVLVFACGGENNNSSNEAKPQAAKPVKKIDDGKGVGPVTFVKLNSPLDPEMVKKGKAIYEMKCAACHKLTNKRVVGPGWKGVTKKRKPEWIMNMTTNVEEMLAKDKTAKELLKECLVRMPNQNLSTEDAREVLEFMFSIDGQEVAKNK